MTKKQLVVLIFVLILGFILRIHNYSVYPQRGASSDEYTYSFLGISLLTKGYPESWSNLNRYPHVDDLRINGIYFPMVHPYFDHPPLNGLLVGGWSILNSQSNYQTVDLRTIRLVPIALSVISSILLFFLALKLFNYKTALWTLLIYSTTTSFVMNQRVVFAENLLTPLLLGSLCLYVYTKKFILRKTLIIGALTGLAFWTKELGVAVFFSMFYLYANEDKIKSKLQPLLCLSGIFLLFFLGYIFYGHLYDGPLFWKIIFTQSDRVIGPETLQFLISKPIIVNKIYLDGWYFLGFISFFLTFTDYKKYKVLLIPAFIYFLLMIFSLTKNGEMGWYMLPMFPFMALFTGNLLSEGIEKGNWYIFTLLLFVGLYEVKYIYEQNFGLSATQFRFFMILLFAPMILLKLFNKEIAYKRLSIFWFYTLILGSIFLTFSYVHPA